MNEKKQREKAGGQKDEVSQFIALASYRCDYNQLLINLLEMRVQKPQVP
jgi:hypothetical protein